VEPLRGWRCAAGIICRGLDPGRGGEGLLGPVSRRRVDLENLLNLQLTVLRRAGHDPQVLRDLDLAAAVGVPAENKDLALRVRLRRLQQHVAHGLAGEERQVVIGGGTALIPGRLTEGRDVGGDDDLGVLLCCLGQDGFQVAGRLAAQGLQGLVAVRACPARNGPASVSTRRSAGSHSGSHRSRRGRPTGHRPNRRSQPRRCGSREPMSADVC